MENARFYNIGILCDAVVCWLLFSLRLKSNNNEQTTTSFVLLFVVFALGIPGWGQQESCKTSNNPTLFRAA